jgi:hypothetical protein
LVQMTVENMKLAYLATARTEVFEDWLQDSLDH